MTPSVFRRVLPLFLALASFGASASPSAREIPVFPDEDAGADPTVPAEMGGKGFGRIATAQGWITNHGFKPLGDPAAVRGGELVLADRDFCSVYRPEGVGGSKNYKSWAFLYDSLLDFQPVERSYVPALATHWKRPEDGGTFSFRLNPNARWSDGTPVTSEDVAATLAFLADRTLADPGANGLFGRFGKAVVRSRYIVEVPVLERKAADFHQLVGWRIYPAAVLRRFKTAEEWTKAHVHEFMMGSGPYEGRAEEQKLGERFTLRRRKDYWADGARARSGQFNFDRLTWIVVPDPAMQVERCKKGDLDLVQVESSALWHEGLDPERLGAIRRGLLRKTLVHREDDGEACGIALNLGRPPWDDLRVRKALAMLLDRKAVVRKLYRDQALLLRSHWGTSRHAARDIPLVPFDPEEAMRLLAEAGWRRNPSSGRIVDPEGRPLVVRVIYTLAERERELSLFQEDLRKAGISLEMELVLGEDWIRRIMERKFDATPLSYSLGHVPDPRILWHSEAAKNPNSCNWMGVADAEVDRLIEAYERTPVTDEPARIRAMREIDRAVAKVRPFILLWQRPYERFLHGYDLTPAVFGIPPGTWGTTPVCAFWWKDPRDVARLAEARKDASITLPPGPRRIRHWTDEQGSPINGYR